MTYQTKLRTDEIIPNENICFPIGTILAVKNKYEKLDFSGVFEKYKKKDIDINSLMKISGSGSARINMKKTGGLLATNPEANEKFVNGFKLSTSNSTNYGNGSGHVDAWVYSEEDGTGFKLSITRDNG